jgi:hypothetical protein
LAIILTSCGSENSTQNRSTPIDCGFTSSYGEIQYGTIFYNYEDDGSYRSQPDGEYTIQIKGKFTKGDYVREEIFLIPYTKNGNTYSPKHPQHWDVVRIDQLKETNTEGSGKGECSFSSITPK